jgi:hypothetical protein
MKMHGEVVRCIINLYFSTVHIGIFILLKNQLMHYFYNQTSYRQVHRTHTHTDNIQLHTG